MVWKVKFLRNECLKLLSEVKSLSHVRLFATPWTVSYQVPPSIGFSRQEYWSGVPLPSPRTSELFINSPKIDVGAYHTATCCRHLS